MAECSPLPEGGWQDLPGRGRAWVWDSGPPPSGGDGPTILLLHGWTSTAALNWCSCFAPVAATARVVAMDHRGHGRGIKAAGRFTLEACADDAAALVELLDLGPVVAAGYSMGGPVAQLLWRRHPDLVAGLVLCATAMGFGSNLVPPLPLQLLGGGLSLALGAVPLRLREEGIRWFTMARTTHTAPWALDEMRGGDPLTFLQAATALGTFDSSGWIGAIDRPTSVIVTTEDRTVPPARQWALARALPDAAVWEVPADHRACVAAVDLFVPALLKALHHATQAATSA